MEKRREGTMTDFIKGLRKILSDGGGRTEQHVYEANKHLSEVMMRHWFHDDLRKWTWWLSLAMTAVPLIVWWLLVDQTRLLEIIIFGLLANITATLFDVSGSELMLWSYPDKLLPNLPRLLPINFTVIPVTFMLLYQFFPAWNEFIIALVITAVIYTWVAEPLMVFLNLYQLYYWKYWYSFPIYIAMGIGLRLLLEFFLRTQM